MSQADQQLNIQYISLGDITPSPLNPRKHFDETAMQELAASIVVKGVMVPILVRPISTDKYEIIAGERRYRATMMTSLHKTIPCIIRDISEEEALDLMIIENLQREDISPIEEAFGFKNLMQIKHMDVKEIAARVGKGATFVAQRMKLCDLIEPIQQFLFDGHLHVKDALKICMLPPGDQQELFTEQMERYNDPGDVYKLNDYHIRKYTHKLQNATFDINDPTLVKMMGPCTTCSFNSASSTVLFPEMVDSPVCSNSACFKNKCDTAFKIQLDIAMDDPAVVLIDDEYQPSKESQAIMKSIDGVLRYGGFEIVDKPELPERQDFDDCDTPEEDEKEYQQACKDYETDMKEYQEKVASGKFLRAYHIGGNDKGHYTYIKIKKSKGGASPAQTAKSLVAETNADDIKSEIQRLKNREKRAKELDDIKIWEQVKTKFDPVNNVRDFTDNNLNQAELTAAAYAVYNKLNHSTGHNYEAYVCGTSSKKKVKDDNSLDDYFAIITQHGLNELLRVFFLDTLPPGVLYHGIEGDSAIMMKIAELYWPIHVATVYANQGSIAEKRADKVAKRIEGLGQQMKDIKKASAAASRAAASKATDPGHETQKSKKGKGVKSLVAVFLLLLFTSCCHHPDEILPICTLATTRQVGEKLHLQIHSPSAFVTLLREHCDELQIDSSYFRCISLSVDPGEVLTIVDGVEECRIITSASND